MAENRFKMRIYSIFRSCKSKYYITNDVVDTATHHYHLMEDCPIFSPSLPFNDNNASSYFVRNWRGPTFDDNFMQRDGRKCPPASPIISPLNVNAAAFYDQGFFRSSNPKNRNFLNKPRNKNYGTKYQRGFEDEYRTSSATLLSSELSSEYHVGGLRRRRNGPSSSSRRNAATAAGGVDDMMRLAVVKRSRDPYADFRASMLEMIVENQIFAARDLRNLLGCFLSLNSCHYHTLILQVFDDISQSLLTPRKK